MNVVISMAGRGARFADREDDTPKCLIRVAGRPMVFWALESLADLDYEHLIFVALREHETNYQVTALLHSLVGRQAHVILLPQVTEGQLCTVLAARDWIDLEDDLLIASADTFVVSPLAEDIAARSSECRGIISVAELAGDRWSFARSGPDGRVVEVAEKVRISNHASTGLYYFASGREFVETGDAMVRRGEKTQGEYYIIPVYQKYIQQGWRVELSQAHETWDMGNPEALEKFEQHRAPGL